MLESIKKNIINIIIIALFVAILTAVSRLNCNRRETPIPIVRADTVLVTTVDTVKIIVPRLRIEQLPAQIRTDSAFAETITDRGDTVIVIYDFQKNKFYAWIGFAPFDVRRETQYVTIKETITKSQGYGLFLEGRTGINLQGQVEGGVGIGYNNISVGVSLANWRSPIYYVQYRFEVF